MPLVPTDYPSRLSAAGLRVTVVSGWETRGNSADHRAVVFHWTASSPNESTSSCANYCFVAADDAPHYNVLIGRDGSCWVGAREKSNSSGKISSIARDEALGGRVNWASAASRGLSDNTSANENLFAISMQNSGVGEPMSAALIDGMATAAAVTLQCLGLTSSKSVTHHAALTGRKIDLTTGTGGCPDGATWNRKITDKLTGGGAQPEPDIPGGAPMFWLLEKSSVGDRWWLFTAGHCIQIDDGDALLYASMGVPHSTDGVNGDVIQRHARNVGATVGK